jgi:anti-sigma factor RsiW
MKNFHDIEQLSSYLDGQLSPSESARLKARLSSDPELVSAFNDIRAARGILRKLPARKAPHNFTLTRQMVGLKPPLPRSYSFFRFSTAFATILLALTFAANALTQLPRMSYAAGGAPAPVAQGAWGLGGGPVVEAPAAAAEAPAATEAPTVGESLSPAMAPLPTTVAAAAPAIAPVVETPSMEMAVAPTQGPLSTVSADTTAIEPPMAKAAETPSELPEQPQVNAERESLVPVAWQITLLALGIVSGLIMLALRRSAIRKWK